MRKKKLANALPLLLSISLTGSLFPSLTIFAEENIQEIELNDTEDSNSPTDLTSQPTNENETFNDSFQSQLELELESVISSEKSEGETKYDTLDVPEELIVDSSEKDKDNSENLESETTSNETNSIQEQKSADDTLSQIPNDEKGLNTFEENPELESTSDLTESQMRIDTSEQASPANNGDEKELETQSEAPAFYANSSFDISNGVLNKYRGSASTVTIPSNVHTIGYSAFYGNKSIQKLIIPSNVKTIESNAFYNCSGLTSIQFNNGVNVIGDYSFQHCIGLKSVSFPNSLKKIGSYAFDECSALKTVSFNNSLTEIGKYAFSDTSILNITIPNSVTTIGSSAFAYNTALKSLVIGNGVQTIPEAMCEGDRVLKSVKFGSKVKTLERRSFYNCSSLSGVTFNSALESIGTTDDWWGGVFENCTSLKSVKLPSTLKTIGGHAFKNTSLYSLNLPSKVTEIGEEAFYGLKSLTSVSLDSSLTAIGAGAFQSTGIKKISIPNKVSYIGKNCFDSCASLTELTIGNSVSVLPSGLASECSSLTTVKLGSGVTEIVGGAFKNDSKLRTINIPIGVTSISVEDSWYNGSFEGCTALTNVKLPDSLTIIGENAFKNSGLKSIVIPNSVTVIEEDAFANCGDLTKVYMSYFINELAYREDYWNGGYNDNTFTNSYNAVIHVYSNCTYALDYVKEAGLAYKLRGNFRSTPAKNVKASPAGKNKVKLTWNDAPGAERYMIRAQKNGKSVTVGYTYNTSYTDSKALDTSVNKYWIYSQVNYNGKWINSERSEIVSARGILTAPKNVKAVPAGKKKVKISWNKVNSDVSYYYIKARKNGKDVLVGRASAKRLYYVDTNASDTSETTYWVYAVAKNSKGKAVPGVKSSTAKAKGTLSAVTNFRGQNSVKGAYIAWNKKADADGYVVYKNTGSGYKAIATLGKNTLKYYDTSASKSSYANYRVKAYYNSNGKRIYSPYSSLKRLKKN